MVMLPSLGGWSYTGWFASRLNGVDIAWLVGLAVSSLVYLLVTRDLDRSAEARAESLSNRELAELDHTLENGAL